MSYCKKEGKDVSIFVTKEDIEKPEMVTSLAEDDLYGVVLPNGELNWDCPCLGGMAHGTCGQEFKDAFSCFHYSTEEEKGSDCISHFRGMQECFLKYPEEYSRYNDDEDEEEGNEETEDSQPPQTVSNTEPNSVDSSTESNSQLKETF